MEYPVYVSFRCEADLERQVRIEAAKLDMNRSEFIIVALKEKLGWADMGQAASKEAALRAVAL